MRSYLSLISIMNLFYQFIFTPSVFVVHLSTNVVTDLLKQNHFLKHREIFTNRILTLN